MRVFPYPSADTGSVKIHAEVVALPTLSFRKVTHHVGSPVVTLTEHIEEKESTS
jgi:hypothetical protein